MVVANTRLLPTIAERAETSCRSEAVDELELFFAESLDLQCIASLSGYFLRLNPAWTACLGWSREELQARPFLEFVHTDDRAATQAEVGALSAAVARSRFENRYRHQDGSYRWLQWNARMVAGGERICATARDVTWRKELEQKIVEVGDRERERLGLELHDGLCQTLAGVAALSATLARALAQRSPSDASAAAEITTLLKEAIVQTRHLARGLAPVGLAATGLHGALAALARRIAHQFHVSCTLTPHRAFRRLGDQAEAHLFRIAQEAVNNAVAHGRPRRIVMCLRCHNGKGELRVSDDGVGMSREGGHARGIGLETMSYRARLIGGSLVVGPRGGHGTVVTCAFPLS